MKTLPAFFSVFKTYKADITQRGQAITAIGASILSLPKPNLRSQYSNYDSNFSVCGGIFKA